jgi:hypothetical protein
MAARLLSMTMQQVGTQTWLIRLLQRKLAASEAAVQLMLVWV